MQLAALPTAQEVHHPKPVRVLFLYIVHQRSFPRPYSLLLDALGLGAHEEKILLEELVARAVVEL